MSGTKNKYSQDPKLGVSKIAEDALDWWDELPIQNLHKPSDSRVGYFLKYYPNKTGYQNLTIEEVLYMYVREKGI